MGDLRSVLAASVAVYAVAAATPVQAQSRNFNVPAQRALTGIPEFARQADIQILVSESATRDRNTQAVRGRMSVADGLRRLLAGTGLGISSSDGRTFTLTGTGAASTGEAQAGDAAADSERVRLGDRPDVLVVGSRLGTGSTTDRAMPIRVITREEIDRSGAGSIAEAMSYMPEVSVNNVGDTQISGVPGLAGGSGGINATTVQLRGLPLGTTLILINGRRAGTSSAIQASGQFDLSTIPLALVERIEVLPAGASAVYGGDALAGVVNIVLRRDASGFEVSGRRSMADGLSQSEAGILWGHSWSGGQVTVGANWRETGLLDSSERDITADANYSRFGGRDLRSTLGFPANVYSLAGCPPAPAFCFVPMAQRGNLPGLNSPVASVPAGQNGQNLTPADFAATAGILNRRSILSNLFSPSTSWSLNFSGSLSVTDNLELFAEAAYTRRDIPARVVSFGLSGGSFGVAQARIPAGNPFNPFGVDVGVDFGFDNTGILQDFSQDYWRAMVGARGRLGRWRWELTAAQAGDQGKVTQSAGNLFDSIAVAAALRATNPATALNPFVGDGSPPWSDQLLQSLLVPNRITTFESRQRDVVGTVRGPLLRLPAGEVQLLVGGEYQRQSAQDSDLVPDAGSSTNWATFAEMRVPVWGRAGDGRERLTLTGAWRQEWSDRFDGSAGTQTVGLEFRPWRALLLRGTYSTAFKPLPVLTSVQAPNQYPSGVIDPRFGGQFVPTDIIYGGGVPEGLKPETGTSTTLGAVWSPEANIRASITWWRSRLRNRFEYPDPDFLVANEDLYPERVIREPGTGILQVVDIRQINIARTRVSGIDVSFEGRWSTAVGDFIPSFAATYMIEHKEQVNPTLPMQDNLGVLRSTGWAPRWKIVPRLGWDFRGIVYANLAGRYVSSYQDPLPLFTGPNAGQLLRLGDFWLIDFNVDLNLGRWLAPHSRLLSGTRVNLGVNNLFDRAPDFCNSCGSGYDASQYDIVGRRFYAALRFSF